MARVTDWLPCVACGATVRHDNGICIRHPAHPFTHGHPSLGTGLRPDVPHNGPLMAPCDGCGEREAMPGDSECEVCLRAAGVDVEASQAALGNTLAHEIARREAQ